MRKIIMIVVLIMLATNCITLKTYAYDYREDTLENSDDREEVMGLEDDILRRSSFGSAVGNGIDFSRAVKVYLFSADEFIAFLDNEEFQIEANRQYVWKIPVFENDREYSYTVVGHDENGSYGFTMVISPIDVEKQTPYIFGDIELESRFDNIEETYIVSIPDLSVDFILVRDNGMNIIPYATRPEFFGFTNGMVYTTSDIRYMLTDYINELEEGWRRTDILSHYANKYVYIVGGISFVFLLAFIIILVKKKFSH